VNVVSQYKARLNLSLSREVSLVNLELIGKAIKGQQQIVIDNPIPSIEILKLIIKNLVNLFYGLCL